MTDPMVHQAYLDPIRAAKLRPTGKPFGPNLNGVGPGDFSTRRFFDASADTGNSVHLPAVKLISMTESCSKTATFQSLRFLKMAV